MSTRDQILLAAADLLTSSGAGDVSTRAICERAGVGAPTLYRHFRDKDGLITAVVDAAFETYLSHKRTAIPDDDPVVTLRNGWDSHTQWALDNPAYYLLIFATRNSSSESASEAMAILRRDLEKCAAAGLLRMPPDTAAQIVMSANVGVSLRMITRPEESMGLDVSTIIRDIVHAAVLVHQDGVHAAESQGIAAAASTLQARLKQGPSDVLSPKESALLGEWLERIGNAANGTTGKD